MLREAEIQQGWMLLQGVSTPRLDVSYTPPDPAVIDSLDAWENKWFPIAKASLGRHFPKMAERVFRNLNQTEGPDVAVSVSTFLQRYDAIATDPEGPAAHRLLASRGLTAEVVESARALVRSLGRLAPVTVADTTELQERWRAAEVQLWGWYLEWSQIIRTAIKDRRQLAQLGFLARRAGRLVEVGDDEDDVIDDGEVAAGGAGEAMDAASGTVITTGSGRVLSHGAYRDSVPTSPAIPSGGGAARVNTSGAIAGSR
jgi:hypothetical protein